MPTKIEKDEISGRETTGHEWDGIKELNTPLPKWWLYSFYASILFSAVYVVLYPAWPTLSSHTEGLLGWTQRKELAAGLEAEKARVAPMLDRIAQTPVEELVKDPGMMGFVQAAGRRAFADNCAGCHGAGGAGAKGFPTLADDDWLWGGSPEQVLHTVAYGVRNGNEEARLSDMPRFGADGMLTAAQIADVSEHVLSLSGTATDVTAAGRGAAVYAENCAACHGERGEGNQEMGAPRLNDAIWLYGGDKASVVETVTFARRGSMPAWAERLDPATVKLLAAYVHGLGGGK
ncbi:MAG TPA: cytochrome-c oxidase, cbb3-type subunit III [Azospirillaceae bacterium]|nr:cytochrome-c oxidase, cbb3-type subunit III [Azospirillaceae bacterium]